MSKHISNFEKKHLKPDEKIVATGEGYIGEMMGSGSKTQHNGSLIVTNERVVFHRKGFFGQVIETIPLKSITSLERRSFLGHRAIKIHTSHDALEFKTFKKEAEIQLVAAIEAGRSTKEPPKVPPASSSPLDILSKLAELRDAGVLSEEEFAQKKMEILSKL